MNSSFLPEIDVVIPAFGRPELLSQAIESVLTQSYPHFNLFIVDDATAEPLKNCIAIQDTRIHWLRFEKNSGPAAARNAGVAAGKAAYVAFLDSDDLWHAEKLARQAAHLGENRQARWVHNYEIWLRNEKPARQKAEHRKQAGQFLERAFEQCLISASAALIEREFFESAGGFTETFRVAEDFELWLRLLKNAPIEYINEPLTIKRAGTWSQLSSVPEVDRQRVLALHRFFRLNRRENLSTHLTQALCDAAIKKCGFLKKGAEKYGRAERAKQYQAWLTLFTTLRTRAI